MKQKKLLTLFLTVATSFSMLVACSNATFAESTGTATVTESTNTTDNHHSRSADIFHQELPAIVPDMNPSNQPKVVLQHPWFQEQFMEKKQ